MKFKLVLTAAVLLAACMTVEPEDPPPGAPQPGDLVAGPTRDGLQEREPDLCGAAEFETSIGQQGSVIPSLNITRPMRVVEFGGIVTQEYNPNRINFWLARNGEIQRISCG